MESTLFADMLTARWKTANDSQSIFFCLEMTSYPLHGQELLLSLNGDVGRVTDLSDVEGTSGN